MLLAGFGIDDGRAYMHADLDLQHPRFDRGRLAGADLDPLPARRSELYLVDARWKSQLPVRAVERPDLLARLRVEHGVRRKPSRRRGTELPGLWAGRQGDDGLLAGVQRRLERVGQFRSDRCVEIGAAGGARDGLELPAGGG